MLAVLLCTPSDTTANKVWAVASEIQGVSSISCQSYCSRPAYWTATCTSSDAFCSSNRKDHNSLISLICCFPSSHFLLFCVDFPFSLIICFPPQTLLWVHPSVLLSSLCFLPPFYFLPFPSTFSPLTLWATVKHVDISLTEASHAWLPSIQMQMTRANYGSACGYVCVCKNTFKGTLCRGRFELASVVFPVELPAADKLGPQADKSKINHNIGALLTHIC